jgi:hypothetical protein
MREFERIFLQPENQHLIWDSLIFTCRFFSPPAKKDGNTIAMKDLVSWTSDALRQLCPPLPLKISVESNYIKINSFLAVQKKHVVGAMDDAAEVNTHVNLLYYFFPVLIHFIVGDLVSAKCVLRLSFDELSQGTDFRSKTVLQHCCMLYESFFNSWKFSLPPLKRHQWNDTYKSLPKDYMFCQKEYQSVQRWHSSSQGQRKVANSCFAKLYQNSKSSGRQDIAQERENICICFKALHSLKYETTLLSDTAFCMGLWIYGHTCSRFPQRWLLENSWKNIRLEYADFVPFVNPLQITPGTHGAKRSFVKYAEIKMCMQLFKALTCYPEHFDVSFTNWLYLFNNPNDKACSDFFHKTVPHLHHVTSRILKTHSKILEAAICDDIAGSISGALQQLMLSFKKNGASLSSHFEIKQVDVEEMLRRAVEECNYENFTVLKSAATGRVCVNIVNSGKKKSLLFNDVDHTIKEVWPMMVKDVPCNVTLLRRNTNTQHSVCILITQTMLDLLKSISVFDSDACSRAKNIYTRSSPLFRGFENEYCKRTSERTHRKKT